MSALPPQPPPQPPPPPPVRPEAHPPPALLAAYGAGSPLDPSVTVGLEVHLAGCDRCRQAVGAEVAGPRLAESWAAIEAVLDAPRRRLPERVLVAVGVPSHVARLMGATPSLRRSWFVAVGVALLFGLAAANPDRPGSSVLLLLALAPLVPVGGVALAYGPGADPAHEITVVTPTGGIRLLLIRSAAVVLASIGLAGAVSMLLVARQPMAAAWLLPALALTSLTLALTTWWRPRTAGLVVAGGWVGVVVLGAAATTDDLAAFGGWGQLGAAVVAVAGAAVLVVRRRAFDVVGGQP